MKKIKTLLCGTNYGSVYLRYLAGLEEFSFNYILSRGSSRSLDISNRLSIKSYTNIENVEKDIELSVIAVDEINALTIAKTLINNGSSILIEHPVSHKGFLSLYRHAQEANAILHINSHFRYTKAVSNFISNIKNEKSTPVFVNASCSSRTLFSTIDILRSCFGKVNFEEVKIESDDKVTHAMLKFNNSNVIINFLHSELGDDNGQDVYIGHSINVHYEKSQSSLHDTWGCVVRSKTPKLNSLESLISIQDSAIDYNEILKSRDHAILKSLKNIYSSIIYKEDIKEQSFEHLHDTTKLYSIIRDKNAP
ncbi:hypothetical protein CWB96_07845 [Pseudoalteromonas citrea]|uniref:Gfo/Idh/MocA-like oxidoreductase N-terminal domain-containing protein n=1 Tax=Pseudoalteromonas citrea TaxID=43655 RepID=A0A5S3XSV4_9GAMM|nr:Gfo/Idh/MocA family oxidoreductase [Pseudoalteromonas citrea]TMP41051.1 hypothetical protein CWB97_16035 [Pseudoalteromonas citrea]TMP60117.1 hypothetical protein CWB96_07845 [Pseudoalteromonas citrea]